MQIKLLAVLAALAVTVLGGCATVESVARDPFVAPGKFQYLHCPDIAARLVGNEAKERELSALVDRAGAGAVTAMVYQPELSTIQSELRQLHQTAVDKNCSDEVLKAAPKSDIGALH
jgi:hypothetical protein